MLLELISPGTEGAISYHLFSLSSDLWRFPWGSRGEWQGTPYCQSQRAMSPQNQQHSMLGIGRTE